MAATKTVEDKVRWLLNNQRLWEGYGPDTKYLIRKNLYGAMVKDSMFSKKTCIVDINFDRLVSLARKRRRV